MTRVERVTFNLVGADEVDSVRDLWLALHRHHRTVSNLQPLVDDEDSWLRRRLFYIEKLQAGDAFLVLASRGGDSLGYALVLIETGPDDTWPLGETYAELYSLSVAPGSRRQGIGTQLLDFVDQELQRRGIRDLRVAVMVGNPEAQRLYERRGFVKAEVVLYRLASGDEADSRGV